MGYTEWETKKPAGSETATSEIVGGIPLYKEFGMMNFTPTQDYWFPLFSRGGGLLSYNDSFFAIQDNSFGSNNGYSGVSTFDVSGGSTTTDEMMLYGMWYIDNPIYITSIRCWSTSHATGSSEGVRLVLMEYDYDEETGDLSGGNRLSLSAEAGLLEPIVGAPKTGLLYNNGGTSFDINQTIEAGQVIYAFAANSDGTAVISAKMLVRYFNK